MKNHTTTNMEHVLLTEDERRLKAATSNVLRPLPAGTVEEAIDLLESQRRRVTVEAHHAWRQSLVPPMDGFDDVDLEVDPPFEPHQRRKEADVNRLFRILDSLETQNRRPRD